MKKALLLLIAAASFSCAVNNRKSAGMKVGTIEIQVGHLQKSDIFIIKGDDKDTVNISTDDSTAIKLTKGELREILKTDSQLNDKIPHSPDINWGESLKNDHYEYDCEACRDQYYAFYAYFLREKNGEAKYRQERKTLIALYRHINDVFGILSGGGTYYGHQYTRILGYAEYSISNIEGNDYYNKPHNLAGQRRLYLKSLKQYIYDEVKNNPEYSPKEKAKKLEEALKSVDEIDHLITTYFYLNMAKEFQYSNY